MSIIGMAVKMLTAMFNPPQLHWIMRKRYMMNSF